MRLLTIIVLAVIAFTARAAEHLAVLKVGNNTYTNVTVTQATATDIFFTYPGGSGNAKLKSLDPELQKHFHYDAAQGQKLENAQNQANAAYQQELRRQPQVRPPDLTRLPEPKLPPELPTGLKIGEKFPSFEESDVSGAALSVEGHKGRVTLIDFWATWCGPCRDELPHVLAAYRQYHDDGFDIIGVSLDTDRNALATFTQAQNMSWPQYFDGQGWNNKLAKQYNVRSIPMSYLLDRHGTIIGAGLRGEALGDAVKKALAAE